MQSTHSSAELPVYARIEEPIERGQGVYVETADGQRLIDFYGGHAVASLGYAHPGLTAALTKQAKELFFQTNLVDVPIRRQAHRALVEWAPTGIEHAFLVNSGAEANENALRLAFLQRPGRSQVVCLEGGFHGRTAAAGAVTAGALSKWYGFPHTPFSVVTVPVDDLAQLEAAVDDDTAAVILEPIQGIAGCRDLSVEFLCKARALTQERGAVLIADEVQCGMGRSGYPFAFEAAGILPDVVTTAKGLGGGFPVGAMLCTEAMAQGLTIGSLGTTFGGGPMAAAVIVAVIESLSAPGFLENVRARSEQIRATCQVGPVRAIQGQGLLLGLRCDRPVATLLPELRRSGILAGGAADPHVLRLTPPLILEAQHVEALAAALAELGAA